MKLHSINQESRLYVMACGSGFSCYGFEVLERKARGVAQWAKLPEPSAAPGTQEHFDQCAAIMEYGAQHAARTGTRCNIELTQQFIGHEGQRVEVTAPDGTRERYWVGKSTGWLPIHLAIKTRASSGGCAVYLPEGSRVRFVAGVR